jgi:predicted regulator of Ras-like GTPase activity (Roadblock/LC7/MglB family)
MDAAQALSDLTEISSQIEAAVVLEADGTLVGSTLGDDGRAGELARLARQLLDAAASAAGGGDGRALAQLEVATTDGSVFIVRDGERTIAATTSPEPTVGLVFYDLKSCLRSIAGADEETRAAATAAAEGEPGPAGGDAAA